jgi:hypothetical protein
MTINFTRFGSALIALISVIAASQAYAGELKYTLVGALGSGSGLDCDITTVQAAAAGNDLAITFKEMNIDMPAGTAPATRTQWGNCQVLMKVTVPAGETVTTLQSGLIGGIEKDLGVWGYIVATAKLVEKIPAIVSTKTAYRVIGPTLYMSRHMGAGEVISEPLFEMNQAKALPAFSRGEICRLTAKQSADIGLVVQVQLSATRPNASKTAIVNVDTSDNRMNLAMNSEACR